MPVKKQERAKLYVLVALTVLMLLVGYVRFGDRKAPGPSKAEPLEAAAALLKVPAIDLDSLEQGTHPASPAEPERTAQAIRDLFSPGNRHPVGAQGTAPGPGDPVKETSFRLRGVVAGGAAPMALINDRFVRAGDTIEGYRIARIEEKEVVLESGAQTLRLRMHHGD